MVKLKIQKLKTTKTKNFKKSKKLNKTQTQSQSQSQSQSQLQSQSQSQTLKLSNKRVYDKYTKYVNEIINTDKTLWNFKSVGLYNEILEHVQPFHGQHYFRIIKKNFYNFYKKSKKFLIKLCHKNDLYGKPNKINFQNFARCSSTNLRYIVHSLLILTFMQKHNLNNIDIIEIGGGYGGLSFYLHNMSRLFNITIKSYTIFDLPDISKLQKVYLEALNADNDMNFYQIDNYKDLKPNSFLIANYSYSEIAMHLQKEYTKKILNPYVSYGFLVWNFIPIYDFIDNKIISTELEVPDTSGNKTNYYVTFIPK